MKQKIMEEIVQQMLPYLDNAQLQKLQAVLEHLLYNYEISGDVKEIADDSQNLIDAFVYAKRIEGCSDKTLKYYRTTIEAMTEAIDKGVRHMQTDDLRAYLTEYQAIECALDITSMVLGILEGTQPAKTYSNIDDLENTLMLVKKGEIYQKQEEEKELLDIKEMALCEREKLCQQYLQKIHTNKPS